MRTSPETVRPQRRLTRGDEFPLATLPQVLKAVNLTPPRAAAIKLLQEDLPLGERPFAELGRREGISESTLLASADELLASRALRRYGAVLNHRRAGFAAGVMSAWTVPGAEDLEHAATTICSFTAVSHCYERPSLPEWLYRLYAMIHGRSRDECRQVAEGIERSCALDRCELLYTDKEYKKTSFRLLTDDPRIDDWLARVSSHEIDV